MRKLNTENLLNVLGIIALVAAIFFIPTFFYQIPLVKNNMFNNDPATEYLLGRWALGLFAILISVVAIVVLGICGYLIYLFYDYLFPKVEKHEPYTPEKDEVCNSNRQS